jgi:hypothetical protein
MERTRRLSRKRLLQPHTHPRFFSRIALFVVLCLVAHSFDVCAAHTGLPDLHEATKHLATRHAATQTCHDLNNASSALVVCENCEHPCESESDVCSMLSEYAVLTSAPHVYPYYQPVTLPMTFTEPSQVCLQITFSGSLYGRDGPPHAFLSSSLRASLPNRAPPIFA